MTEMMTFADHMHTLQRITGLKTLQIEDLLEFARGHKASRGAPAAYLAQAKGVGSDAAIANMEDFVHRVLHNMTQGMDLGISDCNAMARFLGYVPCECGYAEEADATRCSACQAPMAGTADADDVLRRRVEALLDGLHGKAGAA